MIPWLTQIFRQRSFLLVVLALTKLVLHFVFNSEYGYFRDELYYIACSENLDWGFVDHPPLSILLLKISRWVFGDSLFAIRLFPALTGAAAVYLTGLLARNLGGGRFAETLAALSAIAAPGVMAINNYYSMNSFELLFWVAAVHLVVLILNGGSDRLWLILGVVVGLGLLNKISMLWFASALFLGLLLTRERNRLLSPRPWLAALLAVLLFMPNVIWQISHDWPTLEFIRNATSQKMASKSPLEFLFGQVMIMNPGIAFVWVIGLSYFLFGGTGKRYRLLGLVYIAIFLLLVISQKSRAGYLMPAYPMLFAGGAVAIEQFVRMRSWGWLKPILIGNHVVAAAFVVPLALPALSQENYQRYASFFGMAPSTEEKKEVGKLPQYFADMHGWEELGAATVRVWNALPEADRIGAAIFTDNYGEAGAIDFFGRAHGLPPAISGHNSYWMWGHRGATGDVVIKIGGRIEDLELVYRTVEVAERVECEYCMPYESNLPIFVCRGLIESPNDLWPRLKHYD